MSKLLLSLAAVIAMTACGTRAPQPSAAHDGAAEQWHALTFPGKRATLYAPDTKDGRLCLHADAQSSASLWRRKVDVPPDQLRDVAWSWWVDMPIAGANLADADRSDSPARVVFAFDGDHSSLAARDRMMFDLARTLTGEAPPYATLMYVWGNEAPVESVLRSGRTDRVRKIVVDSGVKGTRQWRDHRRDLVADFQRAFGEKPGRLVSVAYMTDGDNTRSRVKTWYGAIDLLTP